MQILEERHSVYVVSFHQQIIEYLFETVPLDVIGCNLLHTMFQKKSLARSLVGKIGFVETFE